MDLQVQFKKLKEGQDKILQMLSEKEYYSNPGREMYTMDDLAKMFKVTKRTIYNWKDEGRLPFVIIGCKTFVTESHLQEFLKDHEVKPVNNRRF